MILKITSRRDAAEDMDDLLVSAPRRNELAVTIHSVSLLSTGFPRKTPSNRCGSCKV